ncbi:hypothetical protein GCM10022393_34850 [Aquimarina addita]|uniref:SH3b domain-containing protein n=1 Tax=Aquimarina addita TaxID=870485 RepID=A0ABP6UT99_9FLAO
MHKLLFFFTLLICIKTDAQQSMYQDHIYQTNVVYGSDVNIRSKPSLKSKIIGTENAGFDLIPTWSQTRDTINGKSGHWVEIKYQNKTAYIWNHLITQSSFRFHTDTDYKVLIKQESKSEIGVKIFHNNKLIKHQLLLTQPDKELYSAFSIGDTYNSNGKEIIICTFTKDQPLAFQWDGTQLTPFTKKLPLSFLSGKKWKYVIGDNVNIRTEPSLSSPILNTLKLQSKVELIAANFKKDTIDTTIGFWHHIKHEDQEAYIWSDFLSEYSIESLKTEGLVFAVYQSTLLAIKDGKVLDNIVSNQFSIDGLVPLGTLGLANINELFASCVYGGGCGKTSGDVIYGWDGKKIRHIANNTGVGDGGLSESNQVIFPSYNTGDANDIIRVISIDSEALDIPSSDLSKTTYENFNRKEIEKSYRISPTEIIEIPNETQKIEAFISTEFKGYQLAYFRNKDFNNDGYDDIIAYARSTKYRPNGNSLLLILFGNKTETYTLHSFHKNLIKHTENDPLSNILISENGFQLGIYYLGYYNESLQLGVVKLDYNYRHDIQDFQLIKEVKLMPANDGSWVKKATNYTKNTVLFKDSWHSPLSTVN